MNKLRIGATVRTLVDRSNDGVATKHIIIPKGTIGIVCEIYKEGAVMVEIQGFSDDIVLFDYWPNELQVLD